MLWAGQKLREGLVRSLGGPVHFHESCRPELPAGPGTPEPLKPRHPLKNRRRLIVTRMTPKRSEPLI